MDEREQETVLIEHLLSIRTILQHFILVSGSSLTHSSTNLLQRDELKREQSMRALKGIKAVTKNAFSRDI